MSVAKKVWRVTVETEIYVYAENENRARCEAEWAMREADSFDVWPDPVEPGDVIPPDWRGAILWGDKEERPIEERWPKETP